MQELKAKEPEGTETAVKAQKTESKKNCMLLCYSPSDQKEILDSLTGYKR